MINRRIFVFILFYGFSIGLFSQLSVKDAKFLTNMGDEKLIYLPLDLDSSVTNGIEIPTKKQTKNGYFNFSFKIKNTSKNEQKFFYKIYYQNESYKFDDAVDYASENFYGSWEDTKVIYKLTKLLSVNEEVEIQDSFKIVGNPRNERIFYGAPSLKCMTTQEKIKGVIDYIYTEPKWMALIKEHAVKNKVTFEEQLYADAMWAINDKKQQDTTSNNRWKRNPRVGTYQFMLIATTAEDLQKMPAEVKDISRNDAKGRFVNPFGYFKKIKTTDLKNTLVIEPSKKLKVSAKIDLSKGVYINPENFSKGDYAKTYYNDKCSDNIDLYKNAQTDLFIHYVNRNYVLHNIPEVWDVTDENYSRSDYAEMIKKYEKSDKLIDTYVHVTDCPCKNVLVNPKEKSVYLKNPATRAGEYKKEHVGIRTRIGFTYGKFIAKIKFPEMLSADNVWNGITNAFWMIAQDVNANWNMRRPCNADIAYIPKFIPDNEDALKMSERQNPYSEIDFEIVKESQFWPIASYNKNMKLYKTDKPADNKNVMVTCTNWDLACHEPKDFSVGAVEKKVNGKSYLFNRWAHYYKALTTKIPVDHDKMFKAPYYYFEIEWTPEKITWRIGPEKNKMHMICEMDNNVTAIPNNQMLMIITQEWHNQEWWPTTPFKQNFIPFPKNDIIGKVLELEVE